MKVLIACEESQEVCRAFREKGHKAFSCDVQECSGGHPEWHIKGDVLNILNPTIVFPGEIPSIRFFTMDNEYHFFSGKWDLIIAHPPCTYLTVTGNRWFNVDRYGEKAIQRRKERKDAISFFMAFVNADCHRIAIENPVGIMSSVWRKPDQIIQPWQFGDPFEKRTCIWLKGLQKLKPTNIVEPEPRKKFDSGKSMPAWYAEAWRFSKEDRAKLRSKKFPGIANAMAEQWGGTKK